MVEIRGCRDQNPTWGWLVSPAKGDEKVNEHSLIYLKSPLLLLFHAQATQKMYCNVSRAKIQDTVSFRPHVHGV